MFDIALKWLKPVEMARNPATYAVNLLRWIDECVCRWREIV